MNLKKWLLAIFIGYIFSMQAFAQENPLALIPTVSDPGLIQKRLMETETIPTASAVPLPEVPKEKPVTDVTALDFIINGVSFEGNCIYSDAELRKIFAPYLHHRITLGDLQNLTGEVTKKYREQGYVLSRAILPPQVIEKGMVKVQVIEGYISKVDVQGNVGNVKCLLEGYGRVVMGKRPFQIKCLERQILLMNDNPGLTVKSVITPSKTIPGSADLTLVAERKFLNVFASYDNFGTRYIGPQQITSGASVYNTLLFPGDSNTVRYITVPRTSELHYYDFLHVQPLGVNGLRLIAGGSYIETFPQFVLQPLEIRGRSNYEYADLSYAVKRSRSDNIYIHAGINSQNVASTILTEPFYNDLTRSIIIGAAFDKVDCLKGNDYGAIDFDKGLPIFGAKKHFLQSRPNGVPAYTKVNLNLSRNQPLGQRFSIFTAIRGQYSFVPLLASQQFAYGGYDFGRGYDPSEIVGDQGFAGKVELRVTTNPDKCLLKSVQYFAFYDAGAIWNKDQVNLPGRQTATSTGLGARFNFLPQLSGIFFVAKPIGRSVNAYAIVNRYPKPLRTYFQINLYV